MFNAQKRYLLFVQITSDLICFIVLYWLIIPFFAKLTGCFTVSLLSSGGTVKNVFYMDMGYVKMFPAFILAPSAFMFITRGYRKTGSYKYITLIHTTFFMSISAALVLFFMFHYVFDCSMHKTYFLTVVFFCILWIVLLLNRAYIFHLIRKNCSNQNIIKHVVLVGTGDNAISVAGYVDRHPEYGLRIAGFLTDKEEQVGKAICSAEVLGMIDNLTHIIQDNYTDCVLFPGDHHYDKYHDFLMNTCAILGLDFATSKYDFPHDIVKNRYISMERIGDLKFSLIRFVYRPVLSCFLKRVFDFTVSFCLIILCIPFWIVIPVAIKLTSPGPVLFRQVRVGKYGRKFILYKFRSMIDEAETMQSRLMHLNEMDGPAFKIKNDPRQTITGRILRKTSLDELPQLFNVFKGDISMVGPRPAIVREVERYRLWEKKRLSVVQGITCLWQVSGRNTIKFDEWMKLDLMYIDTWDFALDLKIFFRTIPAVLLKKGAY